MRIPEVVADRRLAAILAVFLALAFANAFTLRPWCDESWFSSPAFNLLRHGSMHTSVLDPTAAWRSVNLEGIDRHTYWIMPLYVLVQVPWYGLAGYSLFNLRVLSILWGCLALTAWWVLLRKLFDRRAATLGAALIAVDFQFLWSAAVGRMDMMAHALLAAALAVYLLLRERRLLLAVLVSQSLAVAAGLTHPTAVLGAAGLLFATLFLDRARLGLRALGAAVLPYLAGAAAWSLYILRDPRLFRAQFFGNASDRWMFLARPWLALKQEIVGRYLEVFGLLPGSAPASRLKLLILAAYWLGAAALLLTPALRRQRPVVLLLALLGIAFLGLPVIDGFQQQFYLIHTLPLFAAGLAVWLGHCLERRGLGRPLAAGLLLAVVAVQLSVTLSRVAQNRYHKAFLPTAAFLRQQAGRGRPLIVASAEFAFELGFDANLVDDFRLGFRSGKVPQLIVIDDQRYGDWILRLAEQDPANYRYIADLLGSRCQVVYEAAPHYKVYARR